MEHNEDNVIDFAAAVAAGKIKEAKVPEEMGMDMTEWTFSNDKDNPAIRQLFHLLYESVFSNKLGVMHALNQVNNTVETIIVGLEKGPEGVACWPIAKLLTEAEQAFYKSPDGNGNYI